MAEITTGDVARDVTADATTLLVFDYLCRTVEALLALYDGSPNRHAARRLLKDATAVLSQLSHQIPNAYVASHRFQASPGALIRAFADPQLFQPPRDLYQPRFIALQLDLRPQANSALRVTSANGHIEERRPLRTTRHSLCHLTVSTEDDPEQEDTDAALALSFVLEPIHCGGRRLETRLTIATRITPEPWWPRTIPAELAALTEWWLHRLKLHIAAL